MLTQHGTPIWTSARVHIKDWPWPGHHPLRAPRQRISALQWLLGGLAFLILWSSGLTLLLSRGRHVRLPPQALRRIPASAGWTVAEQSLLDEEAEAALALSRAHYAKALRSVKMPHRHFHQEGGRCVWRDLMVVVGGFNVTEKELDVRTPKEMLTLLQGTPYVTIVNLTSLEVFPGPHLRHTMNHAAAVCTPEGMVHAIGGKEHSFKISPTKNPLFSPLVDSVTEGYSHHWVLDLPTWLAARQATLDFLAGRSAEVTSRYKYPLNSRVWWRMRRPLLGSWGAHACATLGQHIYCVGGVRKAPYVMSDALKIYDTLTREWSDGPHAPVAGDHMSLIAHQGLLWLIAGQYAWDGNDVPRRMAYGGLRQGAFFKFIKQWDGLYTYDPNKAQWTVMDPLPSARFAVATAAIPMRRLGGPHKSAAHAPGSTLVALGGERRSGNLGASSNNFEEYWVEEQAWYCHPPLPFCSYGAALAYSPHLNSLVLLGGAQKFFLSVSDKLYVLNLTALPPPQPCLYRSGFNPQWWQQPNTLARVAHQWPSTRRFLTASLREGQEL